MLGYFFVFGNLNVSVWIDINLVKDMGVFLDNLSLVKKDWWIMIFKVG